MSSVVDRLRSYGPGEIALYTFALTVLLAVVTNGPLAVLDPLVGGVAAIGWFVLVPIAAARGWGRYGSAETPATDTETESATTDDALDRLRERYAAGEIGDAEFERRLEALIATEETDPSDALDRLREDSGVSTDRERERE